MSFIKPRVTFPLNFASLFSVMTPIKLLLNITPIKYSSWNIIYFGQKEPIKVQFFSLLSALMKIYPISHTTFEFTRSGFIQVLRHSSVSWKITPMYFCSSNLVYFGQKEPIEKKFWVFGWKFTKFLLSYLKPQISLYLNFSSIFSVMTDNCSVLF